MGIPVAFVPHDLNFGAVAAGSDGPSIAVDPSFGPPAISFAGGVQIAQAPADANVTATIEGDTSTFQVRDVVLMEWVLEPVDPTELPPGHHGPPPKVRVLEVVDRSDGVSLLAVKKDQLVLVRAMYTAPADGGPFTATLVIVGDTWERIEVPLSLFPSAVSTTFLNTPIELAQGRATAVTFETRVTAGPNPPHVHYEMSRTQLHAGVTIVGQTDFSATRVPQQQVLTLGTTIDAPLGDNSLAIEQIAFNIGTGMLVPVRVTADPTPDEARIAIARKAAARADVLGRQTSPVLSVNDPNGIPIPGGFVQHFERGDIYFSPAFGAHEVHGEIKEKYDQTGGPNGLLGFPETDVTPLADRQGLSCDFHAASIYWHPTIGPRVVVDPIRQTWRDQGAESGPFGYPVRDHHLMRNEVEVDLPNPNGVAWQTFENAALVTSEEGVFKALEAPAPDREAEALDALKTFIRARFAKAFQKSPDNVGLHPEIEILGTLPYEHDFSQSTARAALFRLHGFHDNGLATDSEFTIDLALRIGWKLDSTLRDTRAFFGSGVKLTDLEIVANQDGFHIWVVVDLIVGSDGGLRLLVNPEQRNPIQGGDPIGPSLRDRAEIGLLDFLETP
jgi:hypothetical protein